jgi:hypothetical protein
MTRLVRSLLLAALAAVGLAAGTTVTAQGANTATLCHATGNGAYRLLSVNPSAVSAHLGHGDGVPGGEAPGGAVFGDSCEMVANIAGVWLGLNTSYDPNFGCGEDLNEMRLTLTQDGAEVAGLFYWKILESFFPPDEGMEQEVPLTSGNIGGNTFTFTYGPPSMGLVGTATFTDTTMTGTIAMSGSTCLPITFTLTRQ